MDTCVHIESAAVSDTLDPALRLTVEHLLADTVKRSCYRDLCRDNQATPDAVYRLIDGLTHEIKAKEELIKTQSRIIERLRFQLVELVKECTVRDDRPGLQ